MMKRGRMFGRRVAIAVATSFAACVGFPAHAQKAAPKQIWTMPEVGALPDDAHGKLVRRGRDLITATYAHIGPRVPDTAKRYAGNNLACSNCHLDAGTKKYGIPLFGLYWLFPKYSARIGADISIEDRINSCMARSMNGKAMPVDLPEMQAMVGYIRFLTTGVPPGQEVPGLGTGHMRELNRAASPPRGKRVYTRACVACHGPEGRGIPRTHPIVDLGYMIPPLWGPDSFNNGAGMARLITAANFIHFNMPHGADYLNPQLSIADAWDVAAYMISQPHPIKPNLDRDFPDLLEKPVDAPYGPYADKFSERQHKYGPFAPIRDDIKRLKTKVPPARPPAR